ncbi:MAG: hypothetical protein AB4352_06505 [Hormoscilla sp.]
MIIYFCQIVKCDSVGGDGGAIGHLQLYLPVAVETLSYGASIGTNI